MNRRQVLAGIGLGLSSGLTGCLTSIRGDSAATTLAVTSVMDDPDSLSFEIDVLDDQFTPTSVPTLEISVENTGDGIAEWRQRTVDFAYPGFFWQDEIDIGLEREVAGQLLEGENCARMEHGVSRGMVDYETELEPGDSMVQQYMIAGVDEELDGECLDPNRYQTEYIYGDHGTWGFEVEVE